MKTPCFECQAREAGCHSKCERYAELRRQVDQIREARQKDGLGWALARERGLKSVAYRQRINGSNAFWRGK